MMGHGKLIKYLAPVLWIPFFHSSIIPIFPPASYLLSSEFYFVAPCLMRIVPGAS